MASGVWGFWGFGDMVGASWKASSLKLWASGVLLLSVLFEVAKKDFFKKKADARKGFPRILSASRIASSSSQSHALPTLELP